MVFSGLSAPVIDNVVMAPEKAAAAVPISDVIALAIHVVQVILAIVYMRAGHTADWVPWALISTPFVRVYTTALTGGHRSFHLDVLRQVVVIGVVIAAVIQWHITGTADTDPLQLIFFTVLAS